MTEFTPRRASGQRISARLPRSASEVVCSLRATIRLDGEGCPVRRINQYDFYEIGNEVNALKQLPSEPTRTQAWLPMMNVHARLNALMSGSIMEISFCQYDAKALADAIHAVARHNFYKDDGTVDLDKDWSEKIPSWQLVNVRSALDKFEHTLAAELRGATTYYVPRIGIYDTAKLVDSAEQHVDDGLRSSMNEMAVKDFHDAGRCLAFNLPTASGFHAARAVEATLADYYQTFAGPSAPLPGNGTMGDYLKALEKLGSSTSPAPDDKTLRTLREIAKLDRNPVMHPRETLDDQEAAIFFNLATSAIMAMLREMKTAALPGQGLIALPTGTDDGA